MNENGSRTEGWKGSLGDQRLAKHHIFGGVHREDLNSHDSDIGEADNVRSIKAEVVGPLIKTGMKEAGQSTCAWIDSGNVWALMAVASQAGEREILKCGWTLVLLCDDVVDRECADVSRLGNVAVFTTVIRTLANLLSERAVHSPSLLLRTVVHRPPRFRVPQREQVGDMVQVFQFLTFRFCERSRLSFRQQLVQSLVIPWRHLQGENVPCEFHRESIGGIDINKSSKDCRGREFNGVDC